MVTPSEKERMKALEARIAAARKATEPTPHMEEHYSQAQLAWRMVVELVAGLGIGLDVLLGTQPFLMVVFVLLGFIAGVKTMIRSANEVQREAVSAETAGDDKAAGAAEDDSAGDPARQDRIGSARRGE